MIGQGLGGGGGADDNMRKRYIQGRLLVHQQLSAEHGREGACVVGDAQRVSHGAWPRDVVVRWPETVRGSLAKAIGGCCGRRGG